MPGIDDFTTKGMIGIVGTRATRAATRRFAHEDGVAGDLPGAVVVTPIPGLVAGVSAGVGEHVTIVVVIRISVRRLTGAAGTRRRQRNTFELRRDVEAKAPGEAEVVLGIILRADAWCEQCQRGQHQ